MMAIVANNFLCLALSGGGEGEREARLDLSLKGRELLFVAKSFVCLPKAAGGGRGNCCDCLPFLMAFICFDITSLQGGSKESKGEGGRTGNRHIRAAWHECA